MASRTITDPLISYLNADAALSALVPRGFWLSVAPQATDSTQPVGTVGLRQAPLWDETWANSDATAFSYVIYVEAPQTQVATLRDAHDRLYALLHRVIWDAGAEWTVIRSLITEPIEDAVVDPAGTRWHRLGVVAQIVAQHTT